MKTQLLYCTVPDYRNKVIEYIILLYCSVPDYRNKVIEYIILLYCTVPDYRNKVIEYIILHTNKSGVESINWAHIL
jgi:hypothetical protein